MSINYPGTIDVLTNPSGTSILNSPSHAGQHSDANDAIEAIEAVIGTTSGTSIAKNFAAGDFGARINASNVLQQRVSGTVDNAILGTPSISGGTATSTVLNTNTIGTPAITGGTIQNILLGTSQITGGSISSLSLFQHSGTADSYFSGKLGIGTSIPAFELDIQKAAANLQIKSTTGVNTTYINVNNTGGNLQFGRESVGGASLLAGASGYAAVITSADTYPIYFGINNSIVMTLLEGGKLGIGTTSPTAFLHLKAGGTAVNSAPLKLIAGNSLSATEIGAVEYDGTSIFFTDSGTIRQTLTFNAGTQTLTSKTLNNPTIGTPVITAGTATSTVLNTNTVGTPTITGGTWTSGTINAGVLGTPTISDFTNATHAHTSLATGGTVSHTSLSNIGSNTHATIDTHISSTGTAVHGLGNMAVQNSNALSVTGGTVTTTTIGTNTIVGGTATSTVLNTNTIGTPTITGGSFSSGTINNPVIGTQSSTGGTLTSVTVNSSIFGTPAVTGGTLTSSIVNGATLGSPSITSGTLTSSVINNATLGTPTFIVGSDATGDTFYRSSGTTIARLGVGAAGNFITTDGTVPSWGTAVKYTDVRTKIGSFTIDMTTASGTQAVTGLGFSPKSLHFTAAVDGGTWLSHGLDDGTTHIGWSYIVASSSNNSNYWNTTSINNYDGAGVTMYQGYVSSLDADGFTITWTKTGSPTGVMRIFYHAFR